MTNSATTAATPIKKPEKNPIKALTTVGYMEGISFLLLLGVAMPLKYMMGMPEAVKFVGMAHGVLFIAYIAVLMGTADKVKMPVWAMPLGVIASILPFGPFVFDAVLKKSLNKAVAG